MFFSGIIKNLNWEVLTKNLVTFRGSGWKILIWGFTKKSDF